MCVRRQGELKGNILHNWIQFRQVFQDYRYFVNLFEEEKQGACFLIHLSLLLHRNIAFGFHTEFFSLQDAAGELLLADICSTEYLQKQKPMTALVLPLRLRREKCLRGKQRRM